MNAKGILATTLALVIFAVLAFHQWQLGQAIRQLQDAPKPVATDNAGTKEAAAKLRQAEATFQEARTQLQIAEQKLAAANARLAQFERRAPQAESGGLRRPAAQLG